MMGLSFCVGWAHSLQGDISAIVDSACNLVVEYKYDAWGNIATSFGTLNSTLGALNAAHTSSRFDQSLSEMESKEWFFVVRLFDDAE